jgi:hypothetical protein
MQTYCLEYRVLTSLIASVPAPAFTPVGSGKPDEATPEENGIYRFVVSSLGIVTPQVPVIRNSATGFNFAPTGDRFITAIEYDMPGTAGVILAIDHGNGRSYEEILLASSSFSNQTCLFVPQGSNVLVLQFLGGLSAPGYIRLKVVQPDTPEDYVRMLAACCCSNFSDCTPPIIESISPASVNCNATTPTITVRGSGLSGFIQFTITPQCASTVITPSNAVQVSDSEFQFDVTCTASDESCWVDLEMCKLTLTSGEFDCCTTVKQAFRANAD